MQIAHTNVKPEATAICHTGTCINKLRNATVVTEVSGKNEKANIEVATKICEILMQVKPQKGNQDYKSLITFVEDRPGHDWRYAIDAGKIEKELGWQREEDFTTGITKTIEWYMRK